MQRFQPSRRRAWLTLLPALLGLVLLAAACAPSTPPPPLSTSTPSAAAPATSAPTISAVAQPSGEELELQAGVDAEGNFYRGNPNAAVKLVEYSDFQ